jgi:two-component system, chemotaxis family, sensor kinase CheA
MMIEDDELRSLFKTSSEEHIHNLESGLLRLEKQPDDHDALAMLLREAHTLKGDARMLGVQDVETLVHQFEEVLFGFKKGESTLTSETCDRLYHSLDAIRKISHEAVTGEPSGVSVFYVLAQMMGADVAADPVERATDDAQVTHDLFPDMAAAVSASNLDDLFPDIAVSAAAGTDLFPEVAVLENPAIADPVPIPEPVAIAPLSTPSVPVPASVPEATQIDTLRVELHQLDTLMTQTSELLVTKGRIAERLEEIEAIVAIWEDWSREAFVSRQSIDALERNLQQPAVAQSLSNQFTSVQKFHHQAEKRLDHLGELIQRLKAGAYDDTARLETISTDLETSVRDIRLLPLSTLFNLFPRMVRDLAKQQGKDIHLQIEGGDVKVDKRILEEMKGPLTHLLRNAIDHGIETPQQRQAAGKSSSATIRLKGFRTSASVGIEIMDDGRGLDIDAIQRTAVRRGVCQEKDLEAMSLQEVQSLIFKPGFSTRTEVTELSGRGVGLDVVKANVERLKGTIQIDSQPGRGCEFRLLVSANLATTHVLITEVNHLPFGIPTEFVQTMLLVERQAIFSVDGKQTINLEGQAVSVVWLADLLELSLSAPQSPSAIAATATTIPCVILQVGTEQLGVLVDAFLDEQEIILKPLSKLLKRVRNVSGATILGDGEVCSILNPQDLFKTAQRRSGASASPVLVEEVKQKSSILLVEDSIIIRTQMKRLLEGAGYQVTAAVDGMDGFKKLRDQAFDAVLSDVEMPNLDGLGLTAKIRQYPEYRELPIVLVTTLASDADRRRGAEAGASAYLTKGNFDQTLLLETLRRLI